MKKSYNNCITKNKAKSLLFKTLKITPYLFIYFILFIIMASIN